jgi:hypothetical protein
MLKLTIETMVMFVSLSEFLTKREPKSVVALEHPADT